MFQFRRFPTYTYLIQYTLPCGGFPHSDISGSQLICSSPKLFAAYHVLHRLLMPRHSPCALFRLTFSVKPFRVGPISWFSWSLNYAGSIIGSVYPFQQNCNLPKKLVSKLLFEFPYCCLLVIHRFRCTTIIASFLCSVFKIQSAKPEVLRGGPKWTRTIDLTIISRVL